MRKVLTIVLVCGFFYVKFRFSEINKAKIGLQSDLLIMALIFFTVVECFLKVLFYL